MITPWFIIFVNPDFQYWVGLSFFNYNLLQKNKSYDLGVDFNFLITVHPIKNKLETVDNE